MSKVLVTGGSGFLGQYVVRELASRGRDVCVLDRRRIPSLGKANVEVSLGDIRDATAVNEAMAHADSWVHLAGVLGTQETVDNPRPAIDTNVLGGINVLEAASRYGLPGVNIGVGNWFEDNPYSLTKHTVERFCGMYRRFRGVPVSVVRAFNAYGPGQSLAHPFGPSKVRKVMPSFIMRALTEMPIEIYGDGSQVMDMIFAGDVASVLASALEETERNGGTSHVYEAGTGRRTTINDVAKQVVEAVGYGEIRHVPLRPGETPGAIVLANPDTLRPLGIDCGEDFLTLEAGVPRAVAFYRNLIS